MPRFVILEHDHPELHWDLMLEAGEALRTWRLDAPPRPGTPVQATPSFDHRLLYLDYEGPVSGDRGTVKRWDAGEFVWLNESPPRLRMDFRGSRLVGPGLLEQTSVGEWRFEAVGAVAASSPAS